METGSYRIQFLVKNIKLCHIMKPWPFKLTDVLSCQKQEKFLDAEKHFVYRHLKAYETVS